MVYNPKIHDRKSIRLEGYDYSSQGAYFVTICTKGRRHFLGRIIKGEMSLSQIGHIVRECWLELPNHFSNVTLDEFQIMPDHFHGIVIIWGNRGGNTGGDLMNGGRDLMNGGRDLINQIPTVNQILTGIDEWHFGAPIDWPLMKNPKQTLGKIIRHFKAKATKRIHNGGFIDFGWQGKFHDHIVRGQEDIDRIREYIRNNPQNWPIDDENSADGMTQ